MDLRERAIGQLGQMDPIPTIQCCIVRGTTQEPNRPFETPADRQSTLSSTIRPHLLRRPSRRMIGALMLNGVRRTTDLREMATRQLGQTVRIPTILCCTARDTMQRLNRPFETPADRQSTLSLVWLPRCLREIHRMLLVLLIKFVYCGQLQSPYVPITSAGLRWIS